MWPKKIFAALTKKERITYVLAIAGAVVSFAVVMGIVIAQTTKAVPATGGEYTEGMLGQPEYINPVIASSQTDLDLVKMVYSNLADLSDSITASPDLKSWDVRLKQGLTWQDGTQLTADDVVFTVQSIQNPDANSPLYQSWQGVTATRVSELEVQFTLTSPYAFFGDTLNNLYILPKHLFANTPPGNWHLSDYNLKPVGSGPYQFVSYDRTSDGFISSYQLAAWNESIEAHPLIPNFNFDFFNDENTLVSAFNNGTIDGFGNATPEDIAEIDRPDNAFAWPTSAYYAVFFNQSVNLGLQDPIVREALSAAVDRNGLVNTALGGNGAPDYGPIPTGAKYYSAVPTATSGPAFAESLLDADGWTVAPSSTFRSKTIHGAVIPLVVNLTVPQIDFLATTASYLQTAWQAIGVQVNVIPDSSNDIVNSLIPARNYESLLFGNVLGPSSDLYSFWDSSQDFAPGLNLSIYSNPAVDSLIEKARQNPVSATTSQQLATAQADIASAHPAIFLYSPDYVYVTNKNVQGISTSTLLTDPSDRFRQIESWYLNTARVLK
ncbi:MAG TPA: ABC transporter substrate-binding protein [Candidatus Paceibacterota bacterium]|nr:ABC transporter substrate-binding protein [Candidatus Paceibacterota bacterium]